MKIFRKHFLDSITLKEDEANKKCQRYKDIYDILVKENVCVPEIIKVHKTYIDIVFIPNLLPSTQEPDWPIFHEINEDSGIKIDKTNLENRYSFFNRSGEVEIPLSTKDKNILHEIALQEMEYVIDNDSYKFLHMDAHRQNIMQKEDGSFVWLDFGDARRGPESYDKVHWKVDFSIRQNHNMKNFTLLEKKAALSNSLRQYAIFHFVGNKNNLMSYINNVKNNCNIFLKELNYDIIIP